MEGWLGGREDHAGERARWSDHRLWVEILADRAQVQAQLLLALAGLRNGDELQQQAPQVPARNTGQTDGWEDSKGGGRSRRAPAAAGAAACQPAENCHPGPSQAPCHPAARGPWLHRRGHCVGPSTGEVVGSSCTSMNKPSTPQATAAGGAGGRGGGGAGIQEDTQASPPMPQATATRHQLRRIFRLQKGAARRATLLPRLACHPRCRPAPRALAARPHLSARWRGSCPAGRRWPRRRPPAAARRAAGEGGAAKRDVSSPHPAP